ncbi:unnamed protein product, partial [Adineta steineri]
AFYMLISVVKCIDGMFICENDGMFENPTDRSTFWHCANGINYLKNCPSPLVWSQAIQTCTWNEEPSTTITPTITSTDIVSSELHSDESVEY